MDAADTTRTHMNASRSIAGIKMRKNCSSMGYMMKAEPKNHCCNTIEENAVE